MVPNLADIHYGVAVPLSVVGKILPLYYLDYNELHSIEHSHQKA